MFMFLYLNLWTNVHVIMFSLCIIIFLGLVILLITKGQKATRLMIEQGVRHFMNQVAPFLFNCVRMGLTLYLFLALLYLVNPVVGDLAKLLLALSAIFIALMPFLSTKAQLITYAGVWSNLVECAVRNYQKAHTFSDYVCLLYQQVLVFQFLLFYFTWYSVPGRLILHLISLSLGFWFFFGPKYLFYMGLKTISFSVANALLLLRQLKFLKVSKRLLYEVIGDPAYDVYIGHNPTSNGFTTTSGGIKTLAVTGTVGVVSLAGLSIGSDIYYDSQTERIVKASLVDFTKNNPNYTLEQYVDYEYSLRKYRLDGKQQNGLLLKMHMSTELYHYVPSLYSFIFGDGSPTTNTLITNKKAVFTQNPRTGEWGIDTGGLGFPGNKKAIITQDPRTGKWGISYESRPQVQPGPQAEQSPDVPVNNPWPNPWPWASKGSWGSDPNQPLPGLEAKTFKPKKP